MIRLFLSGASREWERAQAVANALDLSRRVRITQRWWEPASNGAPADWSGRDAQNDVIEQIRLTDRNMDGIRAAHVFWLLWPDTDGRSTCEAELGYALASHKPVIVTGARAGESNWTSHATYRDASDEIGLVEILKLVNK